MPLQILNKYAYLSVYVFAISLPIMMYVSAQLSQAQHARHSAHQNHAAAEVELERLSALLVQDADKLQQKSRNITYVPIDCLLPSNLDPFEIFQISFCSTIKARLKELNSSRNRKASKSALTVFLFYDVDCID
jgi:hypothetical protein